MTKPINQDVLLDQLRGLGLVLLPTCRKANSRR